MKAFISILRLFWSIYLHTLDQACIFLLAFLQIWFTWQSKSSLPSIWSPRSLTLLTLEITVFSIWISAEEVELVIKLHFAVFDFSRLLWNHSKIFIVPRQVLKTKYMAYYHQHSWLYLNLQFHKINHRCMY